MDSELLTTCYINVHVSYKTITGLMNGAFSQKVGVCSNIFAPVIWNRHRHLELENQFEDKVLYNNLSMMEKHSGKIMRHGGW